MKDISDSKTHLLDMTLRLLMQLLVQWKTSIGTLTSGAGSSHAKESGKVSDLIYTHPTYTYTSSHIPVCMQTYT